MKRIGNMVIILLEIGGWMILILTIYAMLPYTAKDQIISAIEYILNSL